MIPQGSYLEVENDFKFHYYDEGEGDVVVLLHGSGTGASGHTNFKNNFIALKDMRITEESSARYLINKKI